MIAFTFRGKTPSYEHLRKGAYEGLLRERVALKEGGPKRAVTVVGDSELELSDADHRVALIVAVWSPGRTSWRSW